MTKGVMCDVCAVPDDVGAGSSVYVRVCMCAYYVLFIPVCSCVYSLCVLSYLLSLSV